MIPTNVFLLLSNTELHYIIFFLFFHYVLLTFVYGLNCVQVDWSTFQINIGKIQDEEWSTVI